MLKGAMEGDVLGLAELMVNKKRKNTGKRKLVKGGTCELG
jgi:hypothetical protein